MTGIINFRFDRPRLARRPRAWVAAGALAATAACGDGATAPAACPESAPISMGMADTVYVTLGSVVHPRVTVAPECRASLIYHYDPALLAVEGDSVRTRGYGVARLAAQAGPRGVTRWIAVVPPGTLAASSPLAIHTLSTDLTRRDSVAVAPHAQWRPVTWGPGGVLAFSGAPDVTRVIRVIDGPNAAPRDLVGPIPELDAQEWPRYSADGQWIYFSGARAPTMAHPSLWRARADGSSPQVLLAAQIPSAESTPDPSPDGRRVAFSSTRGNDPSDNEFRIQILDLETRAIFNLNTLGIGPRWSPQGNRIAYVSRGIIYVVNADGTGKRRISSMDRRYEMARLPSMQPVDPMIDWSPDGEWIVARETTRGLDLIQVSTGLTIPLPRTANLNVPAWRR